MKLTVFNSTVLFVAVHAAPALAVEPAVAEFVTQYCLECHQGAEPEGGTSLAPLLAGDGTQVDRKLWSVVVKNIQFHRMPPADADQPGEQARSEAVQHIRELVDNVDCSGPIDPGVVTLRRLTSYEYRRTVRDLLGYDYEQVSDFPSDDVGHGFDNLGDVLTLSPLLYEKYLVAAEAIADAVVGVADGDFQFEVSGGEIEPTLGTAPQANRHCLFTAADLELPMHVPATGSYKVTVKLSPEQAGPNWVEATLLVNNEPVQELELKEPSGTVTQHSFQRKLAAGRQTLKVRFRNDYYQPNAVDENDRDRNLFVHHIKVAGPFGSRLEWADEFKNLVLDADGQPLKLRQFAHNLLTRAYRRQVDEAEVTKLVELIRGVGDNRNEQYKMGIKAALVSPNFLYRVESNGLATDDDNVRQLNDYDVATRLSYFLWSSLPDQWLLGEAEAGRLRSDEQLRAVTRRMLADRRSTALIVNFVDQWLQLRLLDELTKDESLFPDFDDRLRTSMRRETQMFMASILRSDRSVLDILDADYTFVDGRLAKLYDIPDFDGTQFQRIQIADQRRGGVLTQAAILAATARPTRTSPVMRGKWILETLLNDPPPPPAPGVDQLDETKVDSQATLREMLELHRADKACAACHARMDALGFALEEFDAIGAARDEDRQGQPLDTAAEFPDGSIVSGAAQLRTMLRDKYADEFVRCLTEKLFIYAIGRKVEDYDECTLRAIVQHARDHGDRFAAIAEGLVLSDAFRKRRAPRHTPHGETTDEDSELAE